MWKEIRMSYLSKDFILCLRRLKEATKPSVRIDYLRAEIRVFDIEYETGVVHIIYSKVQ